MQKKNIAHKLQLPRDFSPLALWMHFCSCELALRFSLHVPAKLCAGCSTSTFHLFSIIFAICLLASRLATIARGLTPNIFRNVSQNHLRVFKNPKSLAKSLIISIFRLQWTFHSLLNANDYAIAENAGSFHELFLAQQEEKSIFPDSWVSAQRRTRKAIKCYFRGHSEKASIDDDCHMQVARDALTPSLAQTAN